MLDHERDTLKIVYFVNTWQKVKRFVKSLGGSVIGGKVGRKYEFSITAPEGHYWRSTGEKSLCVVWRSGDIESRDVAVKQALSRVTPGIAPTDTINL